MEKIAILTISTGKYIELFEKLQKTIFSNFLPNYEKTVFLFTDSDYSETNNIKISKILHLPWPINTLLRFHYFSDIKDQLLNYDHIYYIDSDVIINNVIDNEIIPNRDEIITVQHFWEFKCLHPYEDNKKSLAYVDVNDPNFIPEYCQACFFGSNKQIFLQMIEDLKVNINTDLKNNVIAKWHDESHFNKYILNRPKKILGNNYNHPLSEAIKENDVKLIHGNVHCSLS